MAQAKEVRTLCVFLVLHAVVSYRSVPRILRLFNKIGRYPLGWVPHFTSTINWTLRLGLGLLKQVQPIAQPWIAIIDHSIDIGTKKALVVLRVTTDALSKRKQAIRLEDCECVGLSISEKVNGSSISRELATIFNQSGTPVAILKDCDRTLQKGVRLWANSQDKLVHVIDDVGHVMASALKKRFEKTEEYKLFIATSSKVSKYLKQTDLAFLTPPKLRSKGRFQSIGKLAEWGIKILTMLQQNNSDDKDDTLNRLRANCPDFSQSTNFIEYFSLAANVMSQVMGVLKNKGLDQASHDHCQKLSEQLPQDSEVRQRLCLWLQQHIAIKKKTISHPLIVSSDIIESLFGKFKHVLERSPQADMNRTTLLIPALCGTLDEVTIEQALRVANHGDLQSWEHHNIPYTMRKKRQEFFGTKKAKTRETKRVCEG